MTAPWTRRPAGLTHSDQRAPARSTRRMNQSEANPTDHACAPLCSASVENSPSHFCPLLPLPRSRPTSVPPGFGSIPPVLLGFWCRHGTGDVLLLCLLVASPLARKVLNKYVLGTIWNLLALTGTRACSEAFAPLPDVREPMVHRAACPNRRIVEAPHHTPCEDRRQAGPGKENFWKGTLY